MLSPRQKGLQGQENGHNPKQLFGTIPKDVPKYHK